MNDRIYYFFDPLCGWCYGFSPTVKKLQENYGDRFVFAAITGGMIRNERARPLSEMAGYIKGAYKTVERHCGVKFGDAFINLLDEEEVWFGSEPPSLAFVTMKHLVPGRDIELAGKITALISFDGKRPGDVESYKDYAESFGVNYNDFLLGYNSEEMKKHMQDEFDVTANLGISGFPALVLERDKKLYLLSSGARPYDDITAQLQELGYN